MQDNEIRIMMNETRETLARIEHRVEALESLPARFRQLEVAMVGEDGGNGTRADARNNASVLSAYPPRENYERVVRLEAHVAREIGKTRGAIDKLNSNIRSGWYAITAFILVVGFVVSMVAGS